MRTDAISVILDKAWETDSWAFIFTDKQMAINPKDYDWKVHENLDILCIFNKNSKVEIYLDTNSITEILLKDE